MAEWDLQDSFSSSILDYIIPGGIKKIPRKADCINDYEPTYEGREWTLPWASDILDKIRAFIRFGLLP